MIPFSVCMSVYQNDKPDIFRASVISIYNQTAIPSEIILVVDGAVPEELNKMIVQLQFEISILKVIRLNQNGGQGVARKRGIEEAKNELIAIMDSDDIALPDRFEKQLQCFVEDSSLSIVGGGIAEFIGTPENIVSQRICPIEDHDIKQYMKSRCGFNQMTVMFRKSDVLRAGNYQHWHYNEDYYLWLRMMQCGCRFRNLEDVLVNVRVGRDMYARRGGWKYFKSEALLQKYMWKQRIIVFPRFLYNVMGRFMVEVLMTNGMRAWFFQKMLRKSSK